MRDRLTKERRSWNMSRIRGKNTSPELAVRRLLHRMGYRFRLHVRIPIPDRPRSRPSSSIQSSTNPSLRVPRSAIRVRYIRPDIVLPKYKTVIFVHGCFWHRHRGSVNYLFPQSDFTAARTIAFLSAIVMSPRW